MNDELKALQQAYREIKAPAYLATRLRAETASAAKMSRRWLPAFATAAAVSAAVWFLPALLQQQPTQSMTLSIPSTAMLSRVMDNKPVLPGGGLSKLRSVKLPVLPQRPLPGQTGDPQSFYPISNNSSKENYHA